MSRATAPVTPIAAAIVAVVVAAAACIGVLAATLAGAAAPAAPGTLPTPGRVLIVTTPSLTWELVEEHRPPVLTALAERGAAAAMSVRTIGPTTSPGEGYVTISAGNRATADELLAGLAFDAEAPYEGGTAAEALERRTGAQPGAAAVVHLGWGPVVSLNARLLYDARPGALAATLAENDRSMAVVANADRGAVAGFASAHREAALAAADPLGLVAGGTVAADLVRVDPAAPFGVRLDHDRVVDAARTALGSHDVVLVELSDLARADAQVSAATPERAEALRREALLGADALLGRLVDELDPRRDHLLVVSPNAPQSAPRDQLAVAISVSGGAERGGLAVSGSTRRPGYVTLPDVAPTVLDHLGVETPPSMVGTPIVRSDAVVDDPVSHLAAASRRAVSRERATVPANASFIIGQVLLYVLAMVALAWRRPRALCRTVIGAAHVVLAVPPVAFLSGLVWTDGVPPAAHVAALYLAAAVLGLGALALLGRSGPATSALALVGLTLAVLVVDVAFLGGRLQLNTVFGYSPIVAGRFAGFGNLAFSLLAISALIVGTAAGGALMERGAPRRTAIAIPAVLLLAVTVIDGHPALGSDVGGVLALLPATAAALLVLAGLRPTWPRLLSAGAASVLLLGAFAAADLARPAAERTHLGRLVARVAEGGDLATVIQRKAAANISILTSSVWTWTIPFAVALLALLIWRPPGVLADLQRRTPGLRACLAGTLVAGGLGFLLNDSGIAVPGMMLAVLLPYLTVLELRTPPVVPVAERAEEPAPLDPDG